MSEQEVYFIILKIVTVAIPIIIGIVTITEKLTKPINQLDKTISNLNATISSLQESNKVQDKRLDRHGREIDETKHKIIEHNTRIGNVEKDIEELKGGR
ncbi:DUF7365 family protein [Peptostreptococcus faecalis]|uniref:DUF7365 family protein n=1 Tax=Peptostreptococcus faecalis TaxID=2045015 RepID=UPI000C7AF082|nr:hypothetical protein [Peptostreptococcus faecalis]